MKLYNPTPLNALDEPLQVSLVDDEVVLIGLGQVAFSMTKTAAIETCRRLGEILDGRAAQSD